MAKLIFTNAAAATVYASMAEGMEEVQSDDGALDVAEAMAVIGTAVAQAVDAADGTEDDLPIEVELDEDLREAAAAILENCLDNSSGASREDDPDTEEYIFEGDARLV